MKNINDSFILFRRLSVWSCVLAVSAVFLLLIAYNAAIWVSLDFNPYFFYIDSCMDLGGQWNYDANQCEGSALYNEWKERTIW
ncbi:MAG: hypothetical protein IT559_06755 [Alphaproteobacteria bacterium]|nr:hypothetical protein [Alphaproteobacteria bacterium]